MRLLLLTLALIAATMTVGVSQSAAATPLPGCANAHLQPSVGTAVAARVAVLCLVNRERRMRRLAPLRYQPQLGAAANSFAGDMVRRRYFSHIGPGGFTLLRRLLTVRYVGPGVRWIVGENIGWGGGTLSTPSSIVAGWLRSPSHRANMLRASFLDGAAGIATQAPTGTPGATYVLHLGRRG